jgi:prevent-host-death family protein
LQEVNVLRSISATQARIHFGEVMRMAQETPVIVERDGKPEIVILSKQAYDSLVQAGPRRGARALLAQAHELVRLETAGRRLPDPAQVLAQVREERESYGDDSLH